MLNCPCKNCDHNTCKKCKCSKKELYHGGPASTVSTKTSTISIVVVVIIIVILLIIAYFYFKNSSDMKKAQLGMKYGPTFKPPVYSPPRSEFRPIVPPPPVIDESYLYYY
jgi:hypothetical protein